MRNIDWSSYLCSSDLRIQVFLGRHHSHPAPARLHHLADLRSERLGQIRVGWDRLQRSIDPVNLLYPFEVDRIVVSVDSLLRLPVPRSRTCCTMARFEHGLVPKASAPTPSAVWRSRSWPLAVSTDRKSVVWGKRVSVRVTPGRSGILKNKNKKKQNIATIK